ncbi:MAG: 4a-hydroxytetrahydrobiopterin dehydratase [Chloroflexota bacterium]|nr:4a-hydroxytetrahydrobiopterin dehydratase [Chloroflexota bacterium]
MPALSSKDVDERLKSLAGWKRDGGEIEKRFEFADFMQSMRFVNKVASAAEAADHHPDIKIQYNKVKMTLSTHSEGGITEKDFALAQQIDAAA